MREEEREGERQRERGKVKLFTSLQARNISRIICFLTC